MRYIGTFVADANSGKAEAGRGNASKGALVRRNRITPVADDPRVGVTLFLEKAETGTFHFFQEGLIHLKERPTALPGRWKLILLGMSI